MRLRIKHCIAVGCLALVTQIPPALGQQAQQAPEPSDAQQQQMAQLVEAIRRAIVTNTLYGVFDWVHFAIQGDTVILRGYASRPALRSSLENTIRRINGVGKVQNEIETLPLSPMDDRIREAVYNAIYRGPLARYTSNRGGARRMQQGSIARRAGGITNDPPFGWHAIHIVVNRGHVTLFGAVDNSGDFALAGIRANTVSGVFSVDNQIQVRNQE
jgi:hyperosmotically inducible periplasmic protein